MKTNKIKPKEESEVIKMLIVLLVGEMLLSQALPHVFVLFVYPVLILSFVFLLILIHKYRKLPDFNFFGNLCFAAILTAVFYLLLPFGQMVGFVGVGILGFVYISLALGAERFMQGTVDAMLMTILAALLALLSYGWGHAPQLIILSFLGSAVFLDLTRARFPMWVRGMFAGIMLPSIFFGFSNYDLTQILTTVTFSALGGLVAGSWFGLFHLTDEKHIEKLLKNF